MEGYSRRGAPGSAFHADSPRRTWNEFLNMSSWAVEYLVSLGDVESPWDCSCSFETGEGSRAPNLEILGDGHPFIQTCQVLPSRRVSLSRYSNLTGLLLGDTTMDETMTKARFFTDLDSGSVHLCHLLLRQKLQKCGGS